MLTLRDDRPLQGILASVQEIVFSDFRPPARFPHPTPESIPRWYRHIDFATVFWFCCSVCMGVGGYELSDVQWCRIEGLLPGRVDTVGRTAADIQ
jgi:hypothetical protein